MFTENFTPCFKILLIYKARPLVHNIIGRMSTIGLTLVIALALVNYASFSPNYGRGVYGSPNYGRGVYGNLDHHKDIYGRMMLRDGLAYRYNYRYKVGFRALSGLLQCMETTARVIDIL